MGGMYFPKKKERKFNKIEIEIKLILIVEIDVYMIKEVIDHIIEKNSLENKELIKECKRE